MVVPDDRGPACLALVETVPVQTFNLAKISKTQIETEMTVQL